jgi:hypothetical protein
VALHTRVQSLHTRVQSHLHALASLQDGGAMHVNGWSRVTMSGGSTIASSNAGRVRNSEAQRGSCLRVAVLVLWEAGGWCGWYG